MFFGVAVVIIGVCFLLQNLGLISGDFWSVLWPSLIILFGVSILVKRNDPEDRWAKWGRHMSKFKEEVKKSVKDS